MKTALVCPHCTQTTETTAPPGKQTKCRKCQEKFRVPLSQKKSQGAEFECPECGESTRSGAAPGQRTTCRSCKAKVRVPLRGAEQDRDYELILFSCPACGADVNTDAQPGDDTSCPECSESIEVPGLGRGEAGDERSSKPLVHRTCPGCGERVPGIKRFCPECRTDIDGTIQAERYGNLEGERMTLLGMVRYFGLPGGVIAMTAAVVWFVAGLSEGYIYFYPPVLFLFGLVVVVGAITKRRRQE